MEFLRVKESLTYEFYSSTRPDTSHFFKAKHSTNRRIIAWENKGSQETETTGERKRPPRPWQPSWSARGAHWPEVPRSPAPLRFGASFWFVGFFH